MTDTVKSRGPIRAADDQVIVFDTTLRDGEQSPGGSMNRAEKLKVARALERLRVDVIEAGFPIASRDDFEAVKAIAGEIEGCSVAGLARCTREDIQRAAEAVKRAARPRIHVFLATSHIHMKHKLRKAPAEVLKQAVWAVEMARGFCPDVEFSPEDASRTEQHFLAEVVEAVIDAGARTVNIPDTVGVALPHEFARVIERLFVDVPNIRKARISVHCHNDLGLASANTLAAVRAGARQVEVTINGIGERAGNAALEEVVMALKVYRMKAGDPWTRVDTRQIYRASHLVQSVTSLKVQRNKAIVGGNAFAHEAGVHQDGYLKHRATYEIIRPEDVGVPTAQLVLGKHSGRAAVSARAREMGYNLGREEVRRVWEEMKALADKKKEIFDADLEAIISGLRGDAPERFKIDRFHVSSGNRSTPTATVRLLDNGAPREDAATGDGPVSAMINAIDRLTGAPGKLADYQLRAVTQGREALGEVTVIVQFGKREIPGRAVSTDVIEASAQAYLAAVNRACEPAGNIRKKK
jgi:2-isopropylmalate synthase